MSLSTQFKMLNSIREFLVEDEKIILPSSSEPKPTFPAEQSKGQALPRCTPEQAGVDSCYLESFLKDIANNPIINAHCLLILRHGKVICEGYFSPYQKGVWHVGHSLGKSFIGTAVGLALREGLFQIDDPLTKYFSDQMSLLGRIRMKNLTVRHLLNMTSGISFNELSEMMEPDWVKGIFSSSLSHEPGSYFEYNSMNSYLLAALLHLTSGKSVTEYLTPRLFEPLSFGPLAWEKSPHGIEKGGWGLYVLPEDLAKLGQLYLNHGRWQVDGETRQILPQSWVDEATSRQAGNEKEGYGYQMWVDAESGNPTMNGMFGQYVSMVPHLDICIVMTAGCPMLFHHSPSLQLIRQYFYTPASLPEKLPENPGALASLSRCLQSLHFRQPLREQPRPPISMRHPSLANRWNQRPLRQIPAPNAIDSFLNHTWQFSQNRAGLLPVIIQAMDNNFSSGVSAVHLERQGDHLMLFWEENQVTLCLPLGIGQAVNGSFHLGEESFLSACEAKIKYNEDDDAVLCVEICLPEHSSLRLLKLQRQGENLLLRLDEHPHINDALEMALHRKGDGLSELGGSGSSLGNFIKSNDFLHYRIAQFCTPEVLGTPV